MTPEQLKSTCIMFRTELERQGASIVIMSIFDSMCSYLGEESRGLNKALAALELVQQLAEDNKNTANELEDQYQTLQRLYRELDRSSGETLDLLKETSRSLVDARKQSEVAYLAYEGLQNDCVSRGEYESLLNKHSALARAHCEAQQVIAKLTEALEFYGTGMCIQKEDIGWNVGFIARETLREVEKEVLKK